MYKKHALNIFVILLGAFLISIAINTFAIANHLAEGGFTGIAILLHYLFGWSTGIVLYILNIPLFFIGYKVFGKQTMFYTFIGLTAVTVCLELTKSWNWPLDDLLLAALYTGVLLGLGLGMIFRVGGTTGGVDILARLGQKYFGISIGQVMISFDFFVIILSILLIGLDIAMYTLVAVFVGARTIDFVVEGLKTSKAVTIISDASREIAIAINKELHRGATMYPGKGVYTGKAKNILYVIIVRGQLPKLKKLVTELDPQAFVVVNDAREVMGEGFTYK